MIRTVLLSVIAVVGWTAFAGDNGGGSLNCVSDSGRTKVSGGAGVTYNGVGPARLVYQIDGHSLDFNTEQVVSSATRLVDFVQYVNKKSYTVMIKRSVVRGSQDYVYNDTVFELNSIPGSFSVKSPDVYKFKAIIPEYTTVDPRESQDLDSESVVRFDKPVQLNCILDLSV